MRPICRALTVACVLGLPLPAAAQFYTPFIQDFENVTTPTSNGLAWLLSAGATTTSSGFVTPGASLSRVLSRTGNPSVLNSSAAVRSWTQAASGVKAIDYWFQLRSDPGVIAGAFIRAQTVKTTSSGGNPTITPAPVVDLAGTVSFKVYVDPGFFTGTIVNGYGGDAGTQQPGNFNVRVALGVVPFTSASPDNPNVLGSFGGAANSTIWWVGNTSSDPSGAPGGILVPGPTNALRGATNGTPAAPAPFVTVTFDLGTAPRLRWVGSADYLASGLGTLESVFFTLESPSPNQIWNIYIDDLVITPGPTASGIITLQGCNAHDVPLTFEFLPLDGSGMFTRTVTPDASGNYIVKSIPRREYQVGIKGSKWLRRIVSLDTRSGNVTGLNVTLLAGDANDDNVVDVLDLDLLISSFDATEGDTNWNSGAADFNRDGAVDVLDLDLLIQNFDRSGDGFIGF
ncbi:MAG: dockerin type I domain-containing protein [Chloroherpetonaceae bacterium]|nr:dockerin type I domain-containing protein [Chthonomonadaceae bacterium]MDW8208948.1 dockerin type I domain-containing protein [Chloroherpetonaceae bacterium]